jgi:hypothetical protein
VYEISCPIYYLKVQSQESPNPLTALYTALNGLGYNSYHMAEAALDHRNGSLKHWQAAIVAKYYDLGEEFRGREFDRMLWRYDVRTFIFSYLSVHWSRLHVYGGLIARTCRP